MRSLLCNIDDSGARWSYDRTIRVTREPDFTYVVYDEIARVTKCARTLPEARFIVQLILDLRPQVEWRPSWGRHGHPLRVNTYWMIESTDRATAAWARRLSDGWSIEVDVDRNVEGSLRSYNWRAKAHYPVGVIQAQAIAWAAHYATTKERP